MTWLMILAVIALGLLAGFFIVGWFFPIYTCVDVMDGDTNHAPPENDSHDHAGDRQLP